MVKWSARGRENSEMAKFMSRPDFQKVAFLFFMENFNPVKGDVGESSR